MKSLELDLSLKEVESLFESQIKELTRKTMLKNRSKKHMVNHRSCRRPLILRPIEQSIMAQI
jgi:hypothetical protein